MIVIVVQWGLWRESATLARMVGCSVRGSQLILAILFVCFELLQMQVSDLQRLFGDKGQVIDHVGDFRGQIEEGDLGHLDWARPRARFQRHLVPIWC